MVTESVLSLVTRAVVVVTKCMGGWHPRASTVVARKDVPTMVCATKMARAVAMLVFWVQIAPRSVAPKVFATNKEPSHRVRSSTVHPTHPTMSTVETKVRATKSNKNACVTKDFGAMDVKIRYAHPLVKTVNAVN